MRLLSNLWIITLITPLLGLETNSYTGDLNLEFVSILFRHGDRTPISFYPNDPFKDPSEWPVGPGELTNRGKMRHYRLGQYFREKYGNLLEDRWNENTIYVRSTDVDRTLMSAESNLAGLLPPKDDQVWNNELKWQPIPIHTEPESTDKLIANEAKCPRRKKLLAEVKSSPEIKSMIEKNQNLFDYLTSKTGQEIDSLQQIQWLYDTLYIETLYNKTLPEWTESVFPDKMKDLSDVSFKLNTWNHELKRLSSGPLLDEIVEYMLKVQMNDTKFKIRMYSGHDTTISSMLNTLGMFDPPIAPPYASTILMELFSSENNKYFVQVSYKNETDNGPYVLRLAGCDKLCPLADFDRLTRDLRPENWDEECLESPGFTYTVTIISYSICGILFSVFIVCAIIMFVRSMKKQIVKKNTYDNLENSP